MAVVYRWPRSRQTSGTNSGAVVAGDNHSATICEPKRGTSKLNEQRGEAVRFVVPGEPVPMARPRLGRGGRVSIPERTRSFLNRVKTVARLCGIKPVVGPVEVSLWFSLPLTAKGEERKQRGDIDNLSKSVLDGLNKRAYDDDRQVVRLIAERVQGSLEGWTAVEIREVAEEVGDRPAWVD